MSTRPAAPDPQQDRHIAFPDEPTSQPPAAALPPSAWAPDPGRRLPPPAPTSCRRPRRGQAAWWVVGAFFALPMVGSAMWSNGVTSGEMTGGYGMPVEQYAPADQWPDGSPAGQPPEFKVLSDSMVAGVQPDQGTFALPRGTTTFRVEVAGGDPRGTLQLIAAGGEAAVPETAMPFAVEVHVGEPDTLQWVTAQGAYGEREIQCRVYAGENLVAIETGQGTVDCAIPPS